MHLTLLNTPDSSNIWQVLLISLDSSNIRHVVEYTWHDVEYIWHFVESTCLNTLDSSGMQRHHSRAGWVYHSCRGVSPAFCWLCWIPTHPSSRRMTPPLPPVCAPPPVCVPVPGARGKQRCCHLSWIWYVFLIPICRGKSDLGLSMASVLAKNMRPHSADFRFKNVFGRKIRWKSELRSRILFASTEVMRTPTSNSPLNFDIENTYQIRP